MKGDQPGEDRAEVHHTLWEARLRAGALQRGAIPPGEVGSGAIGALEELHQHRFRRRCPSHLLVGQD